MKKLKTITLKIINILATVVLVASTALAMLGLISAVDLPWLDTILPAFLRNMSLTETLTTSLGLGGIAGGIGTFRVASREIKRLTALDEARNERRIKAFEREITEELLSMKEDNSNFMNKVGYLLNENSAAIQEQNKHLQNLENFNLITAKRNSKLKVIPNEDKELYKQYIQASASKSNYRTKQLNVKINERVNEELINDIKVEDIKEKDSKWNL